MKNTISKDSIEIMIPLMALNMIRKAHGRFMNNEISMSQYETLFSEIHKWEQSTKEMMAKI
jgi:hypothetical protein